MKLTDAPGWPPWLDVESAGKSTITLRVRLCTWRQRLAFALWFVRGTNPLRWWERPIFILWVTAKEFTL